MQCADPLPVFAFISAECVWCPLQPNAEPAMCNHRASLATCGVPLSLIFRNLTVHIDGGTHDPQQASVYSVATRARLFIGRILWPIYYCEPVRLAIFVAKTHVVCSSLQLSSKPIRLDCNLSCVCVGYRCAVPVQVNETDRLPVEVVTNGLEFLLESESGSLLQPNSELVTILRRQHHTCITCIISYLHPYIICRQLT